MKFTKQTMIMLGVILLLSFFLLRQCSIVNEQREDIENLEKVPDTVYREREIKVPKPYPVYTKPEKVIVYQDTGRIIYKEIKTNGNSIVLFNSDSPDSTLISKNFLTRYPTNHKLISMDINGSNLKLQLLNTSGITLEERYSLNQSRYKYRYVNNQMTQDGKFKLKLEPELSYSFRPLNNLHDIDFGLNFKTSRFNYKLGANGFFYPNFNQLGYDAKVTIQYNFK